MTNYEHYKDDIDRFVRLGIRIAIDKETKKLVPCSSIVCSDCSFERKVGTLCADNMIKWADAEYIDPSIDWAKITVDTPILVRNSTVSNWERRYFAKYEDGKVYAWNDGFTSFTSKSNNNITWWSYAKLAEVE